MIHLWQIDNAPSLFRLSGLYPPKVFSFYLLGTVAVSLLAVWLRCLSRKEHATLPAGIVFIVATMIQGAFYIFHLGFIDEVFVNLDHPWNLLQHGTFSFQPGQLIDGTVEFLYYGLLTPWAWSRPMLIRALMIQGWIVAWAHLAVVRWMFRRDEPAVGAITLLLFACHPGFNEVFAGGFGNGLVSLLFLASIACFWRGRVLTAFAIAAGLPLVRIDAIVYVFPLVAFGFLLGQPLKKCLVAGVISFACLVLVLSLHRLSYGYWVPTPILFKSMPISVLVRSLPRLPNALVAIFIQPYHLIVFSGVLIGFHEIKSNVRATSLMKLLPYLICISIFYYIQARINPPDRYYLPLNVVLCVLSGFGFGRAVLGIQLKSPDEWHPVEINLSKYALLIISIALMQCAVTMRRVSQVGLDAHFNTSPFHGPVIRNDSIAQDALALKALIPKESGWRTASTELDTFGFFLDRPILPLWGYANREIARSKIFADMDIRCDPKLLAREKPELFWVWHQEMDPRLRAYETAEDATFFRFLETSGLGPRDFILNNYELALINQAGYPIQLLVRSDIWPEFVKQLQSVGYRPVYQRGWNLN